jgi:RNA recognition motif-containing protein
MDEEYAKQVCALMGWDPVSIKVPQPTTGQQTNNPGYCFLTFSSPAHAASVLTQIKGTMPNSAKPFSLNWAPALPPAVTASLGPSTPAPQYQREHSIFVGDLAPETSNSDLVAVFRNPVLGLRNDREPKFIRPFLSCKSAKIMLDPVTGVSRGYGFVRFTDEADQQRALIEMHGLYCLSRPSKSLVCAAYSH